MLAADATEPGAAQILGAILAERDEAEPAVELFDAAAAARRRARRRQRRLLQQLRERAAARRSATREAEVVLRQIVGVDAARAGSRGTTSARCSRTSERYDEAVAPLRRAVALAPEHGPNHAVLGEVLYHLGRLRSADASLRRCIELGWDTDVNLWTMLGNTQRMLGDLPEAIVCLERALRALATARRPRDSNLAIVYAQVGRFDEAIEHFRTSIELEPDNDIMHSTRRTCLLTAGEIVEGWDEWEWGAARRPRGEERPTRSPAGRPTGRAGRVLCYREQGVGDEILFASCYPDLIDAAERRRDRVRPAPRVAVRAVVPRRRGPRADDQPRRRRDDARLRLRDPGRQPAAVTSARRSTRSPTGRRSSSPIPERVAGVDGRASPRSGPARSSACRGAAA